MLDNKQTFGGVTLRGYQQAIRTQISPWDVFGQLIVCPTGSGKTLTALASCHDWLEQNPTGRVVWTAMRRELLQQAAKETARMGLDMSRFDFMSVFNRNFSNFRHDGPLLLITDEAHHAACQTIVSLKNALDPVNILGMSATPARADHHALGFSRTILESNYNSLIRDGYLSQYEHYTIPAFDPGTVSKLFARDRDLWGKSVIFFSTNAECREFLELLPPSLAKRVGFVTNDNNRDSNIRRFHENDGIDALINVNILTEGYDEDSIDTVFVRRTDSPTVTTQAAGRVMRLFEGKTKKVVQPIHSEMFYSIAKPCASFDYSSDGWMRTDVDPNSILDSLVDVSEFLVDLRMDNGDFEKLLGY